MFEYVPLAVLLPCERGFAVSTTITQSLCVNVAAVILQQLDAQVLKLVSTVYLLFKQWPMSTQYRNFFSYLSRVILFKSELMNTCS